MTNIVKKESTELVAITPMEMIQQAISSNVGIEQMQSLMDLQERWEKNEARKAYVQAMANFKADAPRLVKNKTVEYSSNKGNVSYDHASLDQVVKTVSPALSANGLYHDWTTQQLEGGLIQVTCTVTHDLGHSKSTSLSASRDESGSKNNIQAMGSTITYLERYTLLALLGLAVDGQDNDAINACETISGEQHDQLAKLLELKGVDVAKFCKHYEISKVAELNKAKFQEAINMVKSK